MSSNNGISKPINSLKEFFKNFVRSRVKSRSYRLILKTASYNRILVLLTFNSNLLGAFLEGSTFGVIYLALQVLEKGSLNHIDQLQWLAPFLEGWGKEQLFISLIVLAIFMQFLRSGLTYFGSVNSSFLSIQVGMQMKEYVFGRILAMSFPCSSAYKIGDLNAYVLHAQGAVTLEFNLWNQLLINTIIVISYVFVLVSISPVLSVVAILMAAGIVLVQRIIIPAITRKSKEITQAGVGIDKYLLESLQALRLIHTFGRQRQRIAQLHQMMKEVIHLRKKQQIFLQITQPLSQFLNIATVGLILILGVVILGRQQTLLIPALFTFIAALNRLAGQLSRFAGIFNGFANNAGAMERLGEVLEPDNKEWIRVGGKTFKSLAEKIEFEEVTLRYTPDQAPALRNLNFVMPRGSVTALVGSSGAGKSSIADLLTGLYDPTEGRITIDGVDLQKYSLVSWREKLGVVSQDTFVFNDPIIENIRYGKPEATEAEVIAATKAAQAHDFIMELPQGYQTVVGERGYRLSGGQRQRLALARAILKRPEVMILDEATSALDSQSEKLVQQALTMFQEDRTVLVVAHRLSTITGADQILVLEQGEIVERGTHQELLSRGERYAHYWQLQGRGEVAVN